MGSFERFGPDLKLVTFPKSICSSSIRPAQGVQLGHGGPHEHATPHRHPRCHPNEWRQVDHGRHHSHLGFRLLLLHRSNGLCHPRRDISAIASSPDSLVCHRGPGYHGIDHEPCHPVRGKSGRGEPQGQSRVRLWRIDGVDDLVRARAEGPYVRGDRSHVPGQGLAAQYGLGGPYLGVV